MDAKARTEKGGEIADALEYLEALVQLANLQVCSKEAVFLPSSPPSAFDSCAVWPGNPPELASDTVGENTQANASDRNDADEDGGEDIERDGEDLIGRGVRVDHLKRMVQIA